MTDVLQKNSDRKKKIKKKKRVPFQPVVLQSEIKNLNLDFKGQTNQRVDTDIQRWRNFNLVSVLQSKDHGRR